MKRMLRMLRTASFSIAFLSLLLFFVQPNVRISRGARKKVAIVVSILFIGNFPRSYFFFHTNLFSYYVCYIPYLFFFPLFFLFSSSWYLKNWARAYVGRSRDPLLGWKYLFNYGSTGSHIGDPLTDKKYKYAARHALVCLKLCAGDLSYNFSKTGFPIRRISRFCLHKTMHGRFELQFFKDGFSA